MKLLITTQAVDQDDPVLGFFIAWLTRFAQEAESVEVICLRAGKYTLPANVHVHPLRTDTTGKTRFARAVRFMSLACRLRNNYDAVFVHMNPEYMVLAGLCWKLRGKPAVLWYTHRQVDLKLRIATIFAKRVLTASDESLRLKTPKKIVMGHGIDTEQFTPSHSLPDAHALLTLGRIAPAKGITTLLDVIATLPSVFSLTILGAPATSEDKIYAQELHERVDKENLSVVFNGPYAHTELPGRVRSFGLFLHASRGTGSLDKAVLEALAAGVPVVSTSPAFRAILTPHELSVSSSEEMKIAVEKYASLANSDREQIRKELRTKVISEHSLDSLIPRILATMAS